MPLHPVIFLFLILPFGIVSGFISVAMAYLLAHVGMSIDSIAELVALSIVPHTWKFLWAPVADTTLTRKSWYIIAASVTALGLFITGILPVKKDSFLIFSFIILASNFAVTFLGMSVESLMAYNTPENEKGRASGWFQAGNLGGAGLGGGFGLWLAQVQPYHWLPGTALGIVCLLCCLGLLYVQEPEAVFHERSFVKNVSDVLKDLWNVVKSKSGYLALLLCFLPIGTGAASGLWSAVAGDWHASAGTVELVTGILSGIASAIGSITGGFICDRIDRKAAYSMFGLLMAFSAAAMALAPHTESIFIVFTLVYAFITGLSYAGFSAFVLEAIGQGAAATKYNLYAALSNMPIAAMTVVDGWGHTKWGASGMLFTEAAAAVAALILFFSVYYLVKGRRIQAL